MSFDSETKQMYNSNLERAVAQLANHVPEFHEKEGKYFAMNIEVSKEEYDQFIEKVGALTDIVAHDIQQEIEREAA